MRGLLLALLALSLPACYQQMADHAGHPPLSPSDFFPDGRSARPIVNGTVARGQLPSDTALHTGKTAAGDYVTDYPFPLTRAVLDRGRERYNIFCSVCHGLTGDGDGRIVQRGFTPPPSYWRREKLGDKSLPALSRGYKHRGEAVPLSEVPVGYIYEVITRGYGAMPQLDYQIPVKDRWAIVGYVRALQYAHLPEMRQKGGEK